MRTNEDAPMSTGGIIGITTVSLFILGAFTVLAMWGCPMYSVYSARKEGEAVLAHAQSSREVAIAEAKAKMESASLLAQADTIRAHGIAESNQIIGKSLQGNPAYLQWLWIDQIKDTKNQIIYLPNTGLLPFTEAGLLPSRSAN